MCLVYNADRRTSCAERLCCWGTMGDHMGPPPGVLGHHSLADALVDDRDHHNHTGSEDDVVVFGDRMKRDGYRKGRIYKKGNWTAAEILVLQVILMFEMSSMQFFWLIVFY